MTSSPMVPSPRVEPTVRAALFVEEVDGKAVQLRLHDIADGRFAPQKAPAAPVELPDLLVGEGVGEAEHGGEVGDGAEFFQRGRTDALRRGVGCGEIRDIASPASGVPA